MAGLRFSDVQARPTELLDLTSLTGEEFYGLVPAFETAFHTWMAKWRLDGKPRTARRFTVYQACPLPTPEDRLLFSLVYLKTYALQVVQGRLFGLGQSKANQWIHVLLPVLRAAFEALGDVPTRTLAALAQRLGLAEGAVLAVVVPEEPVSLPVAAESAAPAAAPLLPMMAPNGGSDAPRMRLSRRAVIAARGSVIP
jgi:Helix-turn-helix of DDE superfamily endonuclease